MKINKLELKLDSFKYASKETEVLGPIELGIPEGAFWSIVGPYGCGKTTILRMLAGLETMQNGSAKIDGVPFNSPQVETYTPSEIGFLSQECERSLLPWLTVRENISWAIRKMDSSSESRNKILRRVLDEMGLSNFCDNFPHELSSGLKQRLALARLLAHQPKILLLDEPCISLDIYTRRELECVIRKILENNNFTVLLATHEIEEAIYLSQKIIILTASPCTIRKKVHVKLDELSYTSPEFEKIRRRILDLMDGCECQK